MAFICTIYFLGAGVICGVCQGSVSENEPIMMTPTCYSGDNIKKVVCNDPGICHETAFRITRTLHVIRK